MYFFILPERNLSFSGIISVLVQMEQKQQSFLEILGHLFFYSFAFHTVFLAPHSFCCSDEVTVLLSFAQRGSCTDEIQLVSGTALLAARVEKFVNGM